MSIAVMYQSIFLRESIYIDTISYILSCIWKLKLTISKISNSMSLTSRTHAYIATAGSAIPLNTAYPRDSQFVHEPMAQIDADQNPGGAQSQVCFQ